MHLQDWGFVNLASSGASVEQREAVRYRLQAPVIFEWLGEHQVRQLGGGFIRDINTRGLFASSSTPPPVGVAVRLEVVIPLFEDEPGVRIKAKGRVIRVEGSGESGGFAATADFALPMA